MSYDVIRRRPRTSPRSVGTRWALPDLGRPVWAVGAVMGKGKMILRILQVTFGAAGGLLVVPVAVNLGTGGTPPPWLAPYVDWLWPVALGCVALVILIELCDKLLLDGRKPITRRRPNDPRNYQLALAQAARHVELRQRGSLAQRE